MVQILPPRTSLGSAIGRGAGEGFVEGANRSFERNQLQKALSGLENLSAEDKANPLKLASALLSGTAGMPDQGRVVSALYPLLLQQAQNAQKTQPGVTTALEEFENPQYQRTDLPGFSTQPGKPTAGQQAPAGTIPAVKGEPNREDIISSIAKDFGESYFPTVKEMKPEEGAGPESFKPQKPLPAPRVIGPSETNKIRQRLRKEGITDPNVQNEYIKELKDFQKDSYLAQQQGFSNVENYQKARQAEDVRFMGSVQDRFDALHPGITPEKKNIWLGLSRLAENEGPDEARFRNTEAMYSQLVEEPLRSFDENTLGLPIGSALRPGEVQERLDNSKSTIQDHLKAIKERKDIPDDLKGEILNNLRDSYFTTMVSKDYGTAQAAYAVSNISPKFVQSIPKAPTREVYSPLLGPLESIPFEGDPKKRAKAVENLAEKLMNLQQDDSLILAREAAIGKNYDDASFNEALRLAIGRGLKLSDFQRMERPKLEIPQRLSLETIMSGKRSIFDFFKRKK